jgi:hypothetical protein
MTDAIEAEYRFPMDETTAVVGLTIRLSDGREIETRVMDKERSREKYEDAVASGHTGYMATRSRSGGMVLSIGNLAPSSWVEIVFSLAFPVT